MGRCFYLHIVLRCTNKHKNKPIFSCLLLCVVLFLSHLVLRCTNRHQNKPIPSCLCLWGGAFSHILYFGVQTGTNTNLDLVVYVYGVVLFLASCTSMYKQAPKQTYLKLFMFMEWCFYSHLVLWCTNRHQNKPILSCLSL